VRVVFSCQSHSQMRKKNSFFLFYCEEILSLCMQREKNKDGFGRSKTMETVKFLGHSAVDWDFMNPHAITFTILFSSFQEFTLLGFTQPCGHVCIIFICGLPHIQTHVSTCTRTFI